MTLIVAPARRRRGSERLFSRHNNSTVTSWLAAIFFIRSPVWTEYVPPSSSSAKRLGENTIVWLTCESRSFAAVASASERRLLTSASLTIRRALSRSPASARALPSARGLDELGTDGRAADLLPLPLPLLLRGSTGAIDVVGDALRLFSSDDVGSNAVCVKGGIPCSARLPDGCVDGAVVGAGGAGDAGAGGAGAVMIAGSRCAPPAEPLVCAGAFTTSARSALALVRLVL